MIILIGPEFQESKLQGPLERNRGGYIRNILLIRLIDNTTTY